MKKSLEFEIEEWRSIRGSLLRDSKNLKLKGSDITGFEKKALADKIFRLLTGKEI